MFPFALIYVQIGDEPFAFFVDCEDPKSCSILLRGANKVNHPPYCLIYFAFPLKTTCPLLNVRTFFIRIFRAQDVLNEIERNLIDAMAVARNVVRRMFRFSEFFSHDLHVLDPKLLPGGGATEMMLSAFLREEAKALTINQRHPFLAVADALEVIPRTLVQNCGASVIRTITGLGLLCLRIVAFIGMPHIFVSSEGKTCAGAWFSLGC
jgi:T-complex protein 1 subunit gamma